MVDTLFYWTGAAMWGIAALAAVMWALSRYMERREIQAALARPILPPSPVEQFQPVLDELRKQNFVVSADVVSAGDVLGTGKGVEARVILSNQREVTVQQVRHPSRAFNVTYSMSNGWGSEPAKDIGEVLGWLAFFANKSN